MPRKNPPNFLHKEKLIELLHQHLFLEKTVLKKLGKNELVRKAFDNKLINLIECNDSLIKNNSTIPCYLYTHVKDPLLRSLIEEYVQQYSLLWCRGSYIANLVAISLIPEEIKNPIEDPEFEVPIPPFLLDEKTIKKCFLPERWIRKHLEMPEEILNIVEQHQHLLSTFLPDYNSLLVDTGWDNAINHMGTSYAGHIQVQILNYLFSKLRTYLKDTIPLQNDTNNEHFANMACYQLRPSTNITNHDYEFISKVRQYFELGASDYINKKSEYFKKLNSKNWKKRKDSGID